MIEFKRDILITQDGDYISFDHLQNVWKKEGFITNGKIVSKREVTTCIEKNYSHTDINLVLSTPALKNLYGET